MASTFGVVASGFTASAAVACGLGAEGVAAALAATGLAVTTGSAVPRALAPVGMTIARPLLSSRIA